LACRKGEVVLEYTDRWEVVGDSSFNKMRDWPRKLVVRMFVGLIIVATLILGFDLLASRFGVESRDGSDWVTHSDEIELAASQGRVSL
jgi:hypothetical protein